MVLTLLLRVKSEDKDVKENFEGKKGCSGVILWEKKWVVGDKAGTVVEKKAHCEK